MTVTVRKMESADIPAVVEIDRASFSLPWPESSYRYEVQSNKSARCFVAEDSDQGIVAMIVCWMIVDELHIATIATRQEHRGMGIGSRLLEAALDDARRSGGKRAFLEVREGNSQAQELYRRFGFLVTGRRPRYYKDNGEDAVLMTLEPLEAA